MNDYEILDKIREVIAAINKLSGEAQRRAIEKHKEDIVKLLRSIP